MNPWSYFSRILIFCYISKQKRAFHKLPFLNIDNSITYPHVACFPSAYIFMTSVKKTFRYKLLIYLCSHAPSWKENLVKNTSSSRTSAQIEKSKRSWRYQMKRKLDSLSRHFHLPKETEKISQFPVKYKSALSRIRAILAKSVHNAS